MGVRANLLPAVLLIISTFLVVINLYHIGISQYNESISVLSDDGDDGHEQPGDDGSNPHTAEDGGPESDKEAKAAAQNRISSAKLIGDIKKVRRQVLAYQHAGWNMILAHDDMSKDHELWSWLTMT